MIVTFYKYQGTGNDFIIIDNRALNLHLDKNTIEKLCRRKFGIGADGLMLLQNKDGYDFEMIYYNADGTQSMCGNGGRCMVQFAVSMGIKKETYHFLAIDGEHEATRPDNSWINLKMNDVFKIDKYNSDQIVNTGSPHYVQIVKNVRDIDVYNKGKEIRYSKDFSKEGVNVNFVQKIDSDRIFVRTYERGVENETLSCGTGATAAAIVFAHNDRGFNRVEVETNGGHLAVEFDKTGDETFENIWLCGPAVFVYKGTVEI
jgi:diaminopimelate epimerase